MQLKFDWLIVLENLRRGIMVTDTTLEGPKSPRIIYVNAAWLKMTGYGRDEIANQTPRLLQGKHTDRAVVGSLKPWPSSPFSTNGKPRAGKRVENLSQSRMNTQTNSAHDGGSGKHSGSRSSLALAGWLLACFGAGICFHLTMNTAAAAEKVLFDFATTTNAARWQVVNDDVMGGVSTSSFGLTNGVAVFRGELSLENNGGFASVRSSPARQNLAGLDAFVVRARGDGRRYKFAVRTENGFDTPIYQCAFTTRHGEWEEHRLAFKDFVPTFRGRVLTDVPALDPAKVVSVGFLISDKQEGPFGLDVAWIKATGRP